MAPSASKASGAASPHPLHAPATATTTRGPCFSREKLARVLQHQEVESNTMTPHKRLSPMCKSIRLIAVAAQLALISSLLYHAVHALAL